MCFLLFLLPRVQSLESQLQLLPHLKHQSQHPQQEHLHQQQQPQYQQLHSHQQMQQCQQEKKLLLKRKNMVQNQSESLLFVQNQGCIESHQESSEKELSEQQKFSVTPSKQPHLLNDNLLNSQQLNPQHSQKLQELHALSPGQRQQVQSNNSSNDLAAQVTQEDSLPVKQELQSEDKFQLPPLVQCQQPHQQGPQQVLTQDLTQQHQPPREVSGNGLMSAPTSQTRGRTSAGNIAGNVQPTFDAEARQVQYIKQQRWLLFLRHASKCGAPEGQCQIRFCPTVQQLWSHITQCDNDDCPYPRCNGSRTLLGHHQRCREMECPVCGPVRQLLRQQQATGHTQQIHENMVMQEWEPKKGECIRQTRGRTSTGNTAGNVQPTFDAEARKVQYIKQQRWLLFLRHASICGAPEGQCQIRFCPTVQQLWAHITQCHNDDCPYPRCNGSRTLLGHHQCCCEMECPVCGPVRQLLRQQRATGHTQQIHENMVMQEREPKKGECIKQTRGRTSAGNTAGNVQPTFDAEARKVQYIKQQHWLLFLRHASKCGAPEGQCQIRFCPTVQQLWSHITQCHNDDCPYPRCNGSQTLLGHHQRCREMECPVCGPVRQLLRQQQATGHTQQIHENMVMQEWEPKKGECIRQTRGRTSAGNTAGNVQPTFDAEARKVQYIKQQLWLLFLRHASICGAPEGQCQIRFCPTVQQLWAHITQCHNDDCPYPRCNGSRTLLGHHQCCCEMECPVCGPVRQLLRQQRATGHTQQIHENMVMQEQEPKKGECIKQTRGRTSAGNTAGNVQPTFDAEARKVQYIKQQHWLLFLRHASKCGAPEGQCQIRFCPTVQQLWAHITQCHNDDCPYPRCNGSRTLLGHHQRCREMECPVCGPVRQLLPATMSYRSHSTNSRERGYARTGA